MSPVFGFSSGNADIDRITQWLLIFIIAVVAIYLISVLVNYIFTSIAITRIGRRRGIREPWLIWIPIARNWAIGALADEYDARNGLKRRFRVVLLVLVLVYYALQICFEGSIFATIDTLDIIESGDIMSSFPYIIKTLISAYSVMFIMIFFSLVFSALYCVCLYKIFESLSPKHCVLHLALSIFVPFYQAICLFCLRNKGYPYPGETPVLPEECEKGWYEA